MENIKPIDWNDYFLEIARTVSKRSNCLRAHVGAVIVGQDKKIKATGYNGVPSKVVSCMELGECYRIKNKIESGTRIREFVADFENKYELIKVYNSIGEEMDKQSEEFIGTGFVIKLELEYKVLDSTIVIVAGDADGDGFVTASDSGVLGNIMLATEEVDWYYKLAVDTDYDTFITAGDDGDIDSFMLGSKDSLVW